MFSINPRLTLFVLAPLPVLSWVIYRISRTINKKSEHVQRVLSDLSTFVQESFSGIRVLKAYGRENQSIKEFDELSNHYKDVNEGLFRINAMFFPMMLLLIGLSTLVTIYIGGMEAIAGRISAGNIAEFVLYVNLLTWPVASIGWVTSIIQRAAASQERINEFLLTEPEINSPEDGVQDFSNSINFESVHFTYPDTGIQALKNVSFKINEGETLAVIGRTGSGKTTLAHLILRLFDRDGGQIRIGDVPIEKIDLNILRQRVGYVPQEAFLFSESIANNSAFAADKADRDRIVQAAKDAEVDANIMAFPQAYETKVGERGITLSGGQKQRVSIARALMNEPDILLFDDCLSAVDTETEDAILENLKRITAKRTSLIISHRVSSVKHADTIIVLKKGSVFESGKHEDLIEKQGEYFQLYQKQLRETQPA